MDGWKLQKIIDIIQHQCSTNSGKFYIKNLCSEVTCKMKETGKIKKKDFNKVFTSAFEDGTIHNIFLDIVRLDILEAMCKLATFKKYAEPCNYKEFYTYIVVNK